MAGAGSGMAVRAQVKVMRLIACREGRHASVDLCCNEAWLPIESCFPRAIARLRKRHGRVAQLMSFHAEGHLGAMRDLVVMVRRKIMDAGIPCVVLGCDLSERRRYEFFNFQKAGPDIIGERQCDAQPRHWRWVDYAPTILMIWTRSE